MKFLIIKPNGKVKIGEQDKVIETYPVNKIVQIDDFIHQYVGSDPTMIEVGDYRMLVNTLDNLTETEPEKTVCNLFLNESTFVAGNVLVISNRLVSEDMYSGVDEMDLAIFINAFKSTSRIVVDDDDLGEVTVDKLFDSLISNDTSRYDVDISDIEIPEIDESSLYKVEADDSELDGENEFIFNIDDISSPANDGDSVVMNATQTEEWEQEYLKSL